EAAQEDWEINTRHDADNFTPTPPRTAGVVGIVHWRLWGLRGDPDHKEWGYDSNTPKDVVGGMCDEFLALLNPDMETGNPPSNWVCGGSTGTNPALTSQSASPATNLRYARVTNTTGSGSIWLFSALTPATKGRAMSANCFFRAANLDNVKMQVK